MDKGVIDKVMFDNFLNSVPTMVVDTKDRKTISAYGSIDTDDLRSAIDIFKKVPDYGALLKQAQKQKEVIDKAIEYINENLIISSILDGKKIYCLNNYTFDYKELLDILKEVSE